MTDTILVSLISTGGAVCVAVTALLLNFRLFGSLERRIELIETDLKVFFREFSSLDKRLSKIEDKVK